MPRRITYKQLRPFVHLAVWIALGWGLPDLIRRAGPVWGWFFVLHEAVLIAATYFNFYYLIPEYFSAYRYRRYFTLLLAEWIVVVLVLTVMVWTFYHWPMPFHKDNGGMYPTAYFNTTVKFLLLSLAKICKELYLKAQRGRQYKMEKMAAELQLLRTQLNPHFLFNTLNNIYSLVTTGSEKAAGSVLLLSDLLHYLLYESNADQVPLADELGFIRSYIDLESLRLDHTQPVRLEIDGPEEGRIAPLILFNFIENAFKHAAGPPFVREGVPLFICISIRINAGSLALEVQNSRLPGQATELHGIGAANAAQRLDLIYGAQHSLHVRPEPGVYHVSLNIPLQ